jgi:glycosyltransferase involved in cell wall biosynthesis
MTTVLMISGSWPPQPCGVGDYTDRLCRELEQNGVEVVRFASEALSQIYSHDTIRQASELQCDLIHIQYPTAGYGRSLTPSAVPRLIRNRPVVVTLHEYSVFRWYRRAWFSPYARHCAARIFTTDEERGLFERRFPGRRGDDLTIEIASNIPMATGVTPQAGRVSYFGLIAPAKGIEAFLDLCEQARAAANGLTFELIGAIPDQHRRYAETIIQRAAACGVQLSIDLPNETAATRLAASTFAYLPFPDGATAKRGTLAAALVNKLIVITRHSSLTPDWIKSATFDAKTPEEALALITRLNADAQQREMAAKRSLSTAARFRWEAIAQRHAELYRQLLDGRTDPAQAPAILSSTSPAREARLAS